VSAGLTPGPWSALRDLGTGEFTVTAQSTTPTLSGPRIELTEANARLIAAAPELYEAALEALTLIHNSREVGKAPTNAEAMLSLAIAKARGL
jgi:hypothetical protein